MISWTSWNCGAPSLAQRGPLVAGAGGRAAQPLRLQLARAAQLVQRRRRRHPELHHRERGDLQIGRQHGGAALGKAGGDDPGELRIGRRAGQREGALEHERGLIELEAAELVAGRRREQRAGAPLEGAEHVQALAGAREQEAGAAGRARHHAGKELAELAHHAVVGAAHHTGGAGAMAAQRHVRLVDDEEEDLADRVVEHAAEELDHLLVAAAHRAGHAPQRAGERLLRMVDVLAQERDDAVIAQVRHQAGAQERGLAHARFAIEQARAVALGADQAGQVVALALAPEQHVPLRLGECVQAAQRCDRPGVGRGRHSPTIPR